MFFQFIVAEVERGGENPIEREVEEAQEELSSIHLVDSQVSRRSLHVHSSLGSMVSSGPPHHHHTSTPLRNGRLHT